MQDNPSTSNLMGDSGVDDVVEQAESDDIQAESEKSWFVWGNIWEFVLRLGLGEVTIRIGTAILSILFILLVIWVMSNFYLDESEYSSLEPNSDDSALMPTSTLPVASPPLYVDYYGAYLDGIIRLAQLDTLQPERPRFEVVEYEVEKGDTIFGIAEKFNLEPETILWANYHILADDPHRLAPGQVINILPVNGVYYEWHAGDGLNGVADFYSVSPEDVISWPGNHLDQANIGEMSNPNIEPGTWLVIPGGQREFVVWSAPRITREDPAVAKILGPGACGAIYEGPVGTGVFIWPSVEKYLSGYDYSPNTNHYGIDIAGDMGYAIFAADDGVVVYDGWNDWGYGNVIVVDHGNGWQTLYAHLSYDNVECGSPVYKGDIIAAMGSTGNSSGPHLHFEMRSDVYGRVNPWNFLVQ